MNKLNRRFVSTLALTASSIVVLALILIIITSQTSTNSASSPINAQTLQVSQTADAQWAQMLADVQKNGTVDVIVGIKSPEFDAGLNATGTLSPAEQATLDAIPDQARASLLKMLSGYTFKINAGSDHWNIPGLSLTVDRRTLLFLKSSPLVQDIVENVVHQTGPDIPPGAIRPTNVPSVTGTAPSVITPTSLSNRESTYQTEASSV